MPENEKKTKKPKKLWWIFNQEEVAIAVSYARSEGGAFAAFEKSTQGGVPREGLRAEPMLFTKHLCAVL